MRFIQVMTIAVLCALSLMCAPLAHAGMFAPPPPMVCLDASIAVVRIVKVIDPGHPATDKPIVLRVQIVRRLRDFGMSLPDQFILKRAPRIALGPNDCSGQTPGLAYLNYPVPKVGASQIVAANMVDSEAAWQEGPDEEATDERVAEIKKEVDALAGRKPNLYELMLRFQDQHQLKLKFEKK